MCAMKNSLVSKKVQKFGFLNYLYGIPIEGQFQFRMHTTQQAEVCADCFGLDKFESIQN